MYVKLLFQKMLLLDCRFSGVASSVAALPSSDALCRLRDDCLRRLRVPSSLRRIRPGGGSDRLGATTSDRPCHIPLLDWRLWPIGLDVRGAHAQRVSAPVGDVRVHERQVRSVDAPDWPNGLLTRAVLSNQSKVRGAVRFGADSITPLLRS